MKTQVIVVGAGHAGVEAALACARLGCETVLLTLDMRCVALMPCNPAIGGTGKGQLVRELDALGGEMGCAIDDTLIEARMLGVSKGPAVHSPRAQADKARYAARMRQALEDCPRLTVQVHEVIDILTENGCVHGVVLSDQTVIHAQAVILCTGVYQQSRILIGDQTWAQGPQGLPRSSGLSDALDRLGLPLRRFKTGTPARVDGKTIDFSKTIPQEGDDPVQPFSFLTDVPPVNRALCYLTYTNEETHAIIRQNLHRAPSMTGKIAGTGARYCPSIEDKVTRFADKERHPLFLEPEGLSSDEWYVQGMSSSMPEDVQRAMYATVPGLENAVLTKLAYAIEYDCLNPLSLTSALSVKGFEGLYAAGQVNGTSGYEEAAAQGLMAGINAARFIGGEPPIVLNRDQAYIGVMIDDLTTQGTDEPYRMMTSRAEYRLLLRHDNADLRLTEIGHRIGLASEERLHRMTKKRDDAGEIQSILTENRLEDRLKRPEVSINDLFADCPSLAHFSKDALKEAEIAIKYAGYLRKQDAAVERFRKMERLTLPDDLDYLAIQTLRIEARQKLTQVRPRSLGQAARIPGVTPADVQVLSIVIERRRRV